MPRDLSELTQNLVDVDLLKSLSTSRKLSTSILRMLSGHKSKAMHGAYSRELGEEDATTEAIRVGKDRIRIMHPSEIDLYEVYCAASQGTRPYRIGTKAIELMHSYLVDRGYSVDPPEI